ncbi:MAG: chromosomal replication initiator protein DnaA [Ktedonobacterales bacterium]
MSNAHVWRAAQERLLQQMTRAQFDTWLRGTWLAASDDGVTVLNVRTAFAKELLETRYKERIEAAIADVTGRACVVRVAVSIAPPEEVAEPAPAFTLARSAGAPAVSRRARRGFVPALGTPSLFDGQSDTTGSDTDDTAQARSDAATSTPQPDNAPARTDAIVPPAPPREDRRLNGHTNMNGKGAHNDDRDDRGDAGEPARDLPPRRPPPQSERAPVNDDYAPRISPPRLNSRYTFSTFIVGSGNQLAHAASQAVAEAPGQAYNPLFLYGGVGLGKTHLLHAIGHTAIASGLTVLYVSSETFTNEIINAIRYRTTEEFRAKYRSVDVLLVDDIQFIAGKDSTEEEFFHTFNTLHESSKQIVICSDRPPKAIVSLAERLRSRFEWGLIADIQPPNLETRVAILRAKASMMGRRVPDDVLTFLASRVQSNIRELDGSFNRLFAFSQLHNQPLTIDMAKASLANITTDAHQRRVSIAEVLAAVADYYRMSTEDLCGKQRDKHIVVPRQIAMYLMRQETDASLLEVGQALGGRDHSTVLHGYEKISREVNENTTLRKEVLAIRQQLLG